MGWVLAMTVVFMLFHSQLVLVGSSEGVRTLEKHIPKIQNSTDERQLRTVQSFTVI